MTELEFCSSFPLGADVKRLVDLLLVSQSAKSATMHQTEDINTGPQKFDLVAAVLRQSTFISKIEALGWMASPSDQLVSSSIQRYGVFLELKSTGRVQSLVPTMVSQWIPPYLLRDINPRLGH